MAPFNNGGSWVKCEVRQGDPPKLHKAFVHKVIEVDGKKDIDRLPLFTAQHKGQWRWSKPDKDAFVKAMEFIQKQLK
jgi:hypothetical protein